MHPFTGVYTYMLLHSTTDPPTPNQHHHHPTLVVLPLFFDLCFVSLNVIGGRRPEERLRVRRHRSERPDSRKPPLEMMCVLFFVCGVGGEGGETLAALFADTFHKDFFLLNLRSRLKILL